MNSERDSISLLGSGKERVPWISGQSYNLCRYPEEGSRKKIRQQANYAFWTISHRAGSWAAEVWELLSSRVRTLQIIRASSLKRQLFFHLPAEAPDSLYHLVWVSLLQVVTSCLNQYELLLKRGPHPVWTGHESAQWLHLRRITNHQACHLCQKMPTCSKWYPRSRWQPRALHHLLPW